MKFRKKHIDFCLIYTSKGIIRWYPWFTQEINFDALPLNSTATTITTLDCTGPDNYPNITDGTKLNILYDRLSH